MRWRIATAAVGAGLSVVALGCGADPDPTAAPPKSKWVISERGTIDGTGIGSTRTQAIRRFGRIDKDAHSDPAVPIGTEHQDLGLPPSPDNPHRPPRYPDHLWRFRGIVLTADRRAWLMTITADGARTSRGVGIGSSLDDVRKAYGALRCDRTDTGAYHEFPYCWGRTAHGRYMWFGKDPVRSITISVAGFDGY